MSCLRRVSDADGACCFSTLAQSSQRPTRLTQITPPAPGFWWLTPNRSSSRDSFVSEASYLLAKYLGPPAEAALLRALATDRFRVEPLGAADLKRMADLVEQYAELGLGATDASLIAVAERLGLVDIATIDHRHFTVVRPAHASAFRLLPE